MSSFLFSFQPLRKRLNKIEKDKTSRIGPQKGLKNAKWKENSRGRKIMSKDSEQKRERRLFKLRSSILTKRGKMETRKKFSV